MIYKRSKTAVYFLSIIILLFSICCFGCASSEDIPPIKKIEVYKDFSVNYIDVGQGDSIFIRLPDGKNVLIDCALNDEYLENSKYIISILERYSVETIDYLVLTHPDMDHIGNATDIINNFSVGTTYIPYVSEKLMGNFAGYEKVLDLLEEKQIKTKISSYACAIKGDGYAFAFLSPMPVGFNGSSYVELESTLCPTDRQINDLSPIIYFECFGKRFIFTGDASNTQEKIVIDNYNANLYKVLFENKGIMVDLENVDYLKVSHHGSIDATSIDFLSLLKPKNFVVSVGKDNYYGHPKSEVLERILEICPNSNLYRTDQVGTIIVHKDNNGNVVASTTK